MMDRRLSWVFLIAFVALAPLLSACEALDVEDTPEETETPTVEPDETPEETVEPTATPEATPEEAATPDGEEPGPTDGTPEPDETPVPEETPEEEPEDVGAEIYNTTCAACHQAEGEGIEDIYPALAGNPFVTNEDPSAVIQVILTGRGGMPTFDGAYSDEEIADIVSYIRSAWDNDADEVGPEDVQEVRQSLQAEEEEDATTGSGQTEDVEENDDEDSEDDESN